jgi:cytochrome b subunit of formate dehydrogenase
MEDTQKYREKTDLEIKNLKASIENYEESVKHNKCTRAISIIALIISGLSFFYLIIKDLILKIIY